MMRTRLNEAAAWLACRSTSRWFSLALVAVIVLVDVVLLRQSWGFVVRALLDEPAHLLTAVVVLGAITRWRGRLPSAPFTWAILIASVLIDADHLPAELSTRGLLYGHLARPYTHALWLLLLLAGIAAVAARRARISQRARAALVASICAGASWGIAAHFLRDVATAPISLLWPLSGAWLQVPYGWYLGAMILFAVFPFGRRAPGRPPAA